MRLDNLVGGAYQSQSLNVDCEIAMNVYVEQTEVPGAKAAVVLQDCPGVTPFATLAPGPIRGEFSQDGRTFAVSGDSFYEVFNDGTANVLGTVAVDANPAVITSNGDGGGQLFLTSGYAGYCFDLTSSAFTTVLDTGATTCDFLDGYILVLDVPNSVLKISNFEDATTFQSTQFAQRTAGADRWVALKVVHTDIWLLGSQTSEVWYDAGTFPFPFAPRPGAFLQQGCAAGFSLAQVNSTLIWLAHNEQGAGMVVMANGYAPQRISTHPIDYALQSYPTISDAVAFSYQQIGHAFYVLVLPTAGATWAYDAVTNLWHARGTWNARTSQYDAYRVQTHCATVNNLHLVGDRLTGAIYRLNAEVCTEVDGTGIRRQRRFRAMADNQSGHYLFYRNLQIDAQTGVGLATGQGSDPQLQISWSRDSGYTWAATQWTSLGAQGQYAYRAMIRGILGRARNLVIDLVCSEPVPFRLIQGFVDVEEGTW